MEQTASSLLFYLNGKRIELHTGDHELHPEWTLLEYLREVEGLRGTKLGCGQGMCGACTVAVRYWDTTSQMVRLRSMNACILPMCSLDLTSVYTVEGIGDARHPHPVQERVCEMHGTQCGFCTPGVVMSMYTMLENATTPPSLSMLEEAIDGNLCRCTGYRPILDSIKSFAGSTVIPVNSGSPGFPAELRQRSAASAQSLHLTGPRCVLPGGSDTKGGPLLERAHWHQPNSLQGLLELRLKLGSTARVVGGETDFMKRQRRTHRAFISPQHVPELRGIEITPSIAATIALSPQEQIAVQHSVRVGSAVTIAELLDWITSTLATPTAAPFVHGLTALHQQLMQVATPQSRNSAALGSFLHASDIAPLLVAMAATVELSSALGPSPRSRKVAAADLLVIDPITGICADSVADHEVVVAITAPLGARFSFVRAVKCAPRRLGATGLITLAIHADFVAAESAGTGSGEEWVATRVVLCVGGMSLLHSRHGVVQAVECERWLEGKAWTRATIERACVLLREGLPIAAAEHDYLRQVIIVQCG
jgi:xanthine dehydrogenase/oxidase